MLARVDIANLPKYGDAEWLALPDGDPCKVYPLVIAAEAWAVDGETYPQRLADELVEWRLRWEQRESDWLEWAVWPEVAEHVRHIADRPDFAELQLLRYGPGVASHD